MPKLVPSEVMDYTSFQSVKDRTSIQMDGDILQAEQDVFSFCGHDFSDEVFYPEVVKLALIKLAEYYALVNSDESLVKGVTSEKLGDYSYTINGEVKTFSLATLLRNYVKEKGKKGTTFKVRAF